MCVRKCKCLDVCHEGSGTSGCLGGRRISVIDGAQPSRRVASLGGGAGTDDTSEDDTDGIMLPTPTRPNQASG